MLKQLQLKLSQKLSPQQIQLTEVDSTANARFFEQRLQNELEETPALETEKKRAHKKIAMIKITRILPK